MMNSSQQPIKRGCYCPNDMSADEVKTSMQGKLELIPNKVQNALTTGHEA